MPNPAIVILTISPHLLKHTHSEVSWDEVDTTHGEWMNTQRMCKETLPAVALPICDVSLCTHSFPHSCLLSVCMQIRCPSAQNYSLDSAVVHRSVLSCRISIKISHLWTLICQLNINTMGHFQFTARPLLSWQFIPNHLCYKKKSVLLNSVRTESQGWCGVGDSISD